MHEIDFHDARATVFRDPSTDAVVADGVGNEEVVEGVCGCYFGWVVAGFGVGLDDVREEGGEGVRAAEGAIVALEEGADGAVFVAGGGVGEGAVEDFHVVVVVDVGVLAVGVVVGVEGEFEGGGEVDEVGHG